MKALVRVPGGVELATHPDPDPRSDEVVVAVHSCGICGSDVHSVEASTSRGGILGHEFAGTIAHVGSAVQGWQPGRAVAVNPLGSCGECEPCRLRIPIRCANRPNLGLSAPGGFAEYVAVPAAQLCALPEGMPTELGSRVEPLAVAVRAVDEGRAEPGDNTIVFGVGPIGLHVILALRAAGAGTIVAVGRSSQGRREAAARCGADVVLDSRETDVADYVRTRGITISQAYECSSDSQALVVLSQAVKPGGTLVGLALGWSPAAFNLGTFVGKGLRLFGSCAFDAADYRRALELIASGRANVAPLISERIGLAEAPEAFMRLRHPGPLVSVLVQPFR